MLYKGLQGVENTYCGAVSTLTSDSYWHVRQIRFRSWHSVWSSRVLKLVLWNVCWIVSLT